MKQPKRPCLECRILITPTKDNPSYCTTHKPLMKKYDKEAKE